jgi:vacuolar-type H+-ATPase subunit E/Vma4
MDSKQVTEKILSEAQSQADKIKEQADEKVRQERQKLQTELDNFNEETRRLVKQALEEAKSRTLAWARMEIAKKLLRTRKDLLDETFAAAAEKIKNMSAKDYQQLMEKLILSAVNTGDEEIIIDKNEKRIDAAFVERLNAKLSQNSRGNLKIADSKAYIEAGFILQKGRARVNGSLAVLLAAAKEKLEAELAAQLFV